MKTSELRILLIFIASCAIYNFFSFNLGFAQYFKTANSQNRDHHSKLNHDIKEYYFANATTDVFYLIFSAAKNIENRNMIRKTWAKKLMATGNYKFIIGKDYCKIASHHRQKVVTTKMSSNNDDNHNANNLDISCTPKPELLANGTVIEYLPNGNPFMENVYEKVKTEAQKNHDIIFVNMVDTYQNGSLKYLLAYDRLVRQMETKNNKIRLKAYREDDRPRWIFQLDDSSLVILGLVVLFLFIGLITVLATCQN